MLDMVPTDKSEAFPAKNYHPFSSSLVLLIKRTHVREGRGGAPI